MQVESIMQKNVVTATPDMSLGEVQRVMRDKHIRHLPVVRGKTLVGMITDRDLRDALPSPATTLSRGEIAYQLDTTTVNTCMTTQVVSIAPDMQIVRAVDVLLEHKFGCLPVVQRGTLIGVVTEIDFLRVFLAASRA